MLSRFRLPNQSKTEKIIKIIRKDIIILLVKFVFIAFMAIVPLSIPYIFNLEGFNSVGQILSALSLSIYYLSIWLFLFFIFIDYYLDFWLITNERIISVDQNGFFSRTIAEHRLEKIQDVTSEVHGLIPTLFIYGNVFVQTAGTRQRFSFLQVPEPENIRNLIIGLSEQRKRVTHVDEQRKK